MLKVLIITYAIMAITHATSAVSGLTAGSTGARGSQPAAPKVRFQNRDPWEVVDWYAGAIIGVYEPLITRAYDADCFSALFSWGLAMIPTHQYFDKETPLKTFGNWLGLLLPWSITAYDTYAVTAACVSQLREIKLIYFFDRRPHFPDFATEVLGPAFVQSSSVGRTGVDMNAQVEEVGLTHRVGDDAQGKARMQVGQLAVQSPSVGGEAGNVLVRFFAKMVYKLKIFINHPAFKAVQMMFVVTFNLYNVAGGFTSSFYYFDNGRQLGKAISAIFCEFDLWSEQGLITPTKPWVRRQQREVYDNNPDLML